MALTGELPLRSSRHLPLPSSIAGYRPSNPKEAIPEWICSLVARSTSADPSARFPTALNFLQALESEPRPEFNLTELTHNRAHFCILCNEYSLLTEGVCAKCKSLTSKERQVFIFVQQEKRLNSSGQVLAQLSDIPLNSFEINDCLNGVRPLLKLPESEAKTFINRLSNAGIPTEVCRSLNTFQRIPKTFYLLILMVIVAGIAAALYANPIFFLSTALVAILLAVVGYRLSNQPLISSNSKSRWPETTHFKIVSLWRSLSTTTAKNLIGDLIVLCRNLIVNPKTSEEILKYLSELLESSGNAALELDRIEQMLQRLENQKAAISQTPKQWVESFSAGEQARDILVQRLLEAIATVGHFQIDVALSSSGFAQQLKDCTQQLQNEIEIQAIVAKELISLREKELL